MIIPKIGVGAKVTLTDIIKHAYEFLKTLDIVLKDTPIDERIWFKLVHLVELVNTTCEQPIDDLITRVKHVVLGDWFWGQNLVFKGV